MTTEVDWEFFEKPYFYYGVAGLIIGAVEVVVGLFLPSRVLSKPVRNLNPPHYSD